MKITFPIPVSSIINSTTQVSLISTSDANEAYLTFELEPGPEPASQVISISPQPPALLDNS